MKRKKTKKELDEAKKKRKEYLKQWYLDNKESINNRSKQYYQDHRLQRIEYATEYQKNNPEQIKVYQLKHKLRKKAGLT